MRGLSKLAERVAPRSFPPHDFFADTPPAALFELFGPIPSSVFFYADPFESSVSVLCPKTVGLRQDFPARYHTRTNRPFPEAP